MPVRPDGSPAEEKGGPLSKRSPATPPRPVGSGQVPKTGRSASARAPQATAAIQVQSVFQPKPLRLAEDEPPGPDHRRQQDDDGGQAEELHEEIGDHGADDAEDVARRVVGGVAEARIVDRPGGETGGDRGGEGEERQAQDRAEISSDQAAKGTLARNRKRDRSGRTHWPPLANEARSSAAVGDKPVGAPIPAMGDAVAGTASDIGRGTAKPAIRVDPRLNSGSTVARLW